MMSKSYFLAVCLMASGTAFAAGPPSKQSVSKYLHLSQKSPFTNEPTVDAGPRPVSVLDDWSLGGVSEVEGGYMVTLVNKKNQGETQIIKPRGTVHSTKDEMKWINPGAPGSFKVDKVEFGKTSWKETTVMVSVGDEKGTMTFDDKQLAPAAAAAPAGGVRPPGQAGQLPTPVAIPQTAQPSGHSPRQRVHQTPAPNTQSRPTR